MERSRKAKIFISSLVVLFLLSFGIVYAVLKNQGTEEEQVLGTTNEESILVGVENTYGTPYIVSTPTVEFEEGGMYEYYPRIEDADSDYTSLSMELVDAPEWLYINDMSVVGSIPYGVGETYEYTLRVSDGVNSSSQKNYILATEASE